MFGGWRDSRLRNWVKQADLDERRRRAGLTPAQREDPVRLRRELRVAKLENAILERTAACFSKEHILSRAIFERAEPGYLPRRRHSCKDGLSRIDYETAHAA